MGTIHAQEVAISVAEGKALVGVVLRHQVPFDIALLPD